ncbi:MAG: hypothetical protein AABY49_04230 [Planctomycetota bacterium]
MSRKKSYYHIKKIWTQMIMMPNMKLGEDLDKVIDTAGGFSSFSIINIKRLFA